MFSFLLLVAKARRPVLFSRELKVSGCQLLITSNRNSAYRGLFKERFVYSASVDEAIQPMKIIRIPVIFLLFLLATQGSYGQKIWYDDNWKKTTQENAAYYRLIDTLAEDLYEVKDYYLDGTLQMIGKFISMKKDIRTGQFLWYHKNGKPSTERNFINGKVHGVYRRWDASGILRTEGYYLDHRADSSWTWWYENGILQSEGSFRQGKRHGMWITYHPNGIKNEASRFKKGKFDGYAAHWDISGMPVMEFDMDAKLKNGRVNLYHPNGNLRGTGELKKGKPDGIWEDYYPSGDIRSRGRIVKGYRMGMWNYYNRDGSISRIDIYDKKNKEKVEDFTKELRAILRKNL